MAGGFGLDALAESAEPLEPQEPLEPLELLVPLVLPVSVDFAALVLPGSLAAGLAAEGAPVLLVRESVR